MSLRSVILVALADEDRSGYEITKDFETVLGYFWSASHQQVYRELKKMDEEGLVACRVEPQGSKPDRKLYSITDRGREDLLAWLQAPPAHPPVRSPLLVKVYGGMISGPEPLEAHIDTFYRESEAALNGFKAIEEEHYPEPVEEMEDWKKLAYLTLRFGMLRRQADARWASEAREILRSIMAPDREKSPKKNKP